MPPVHLHCRTAGLLLAAVLLAPWSPARADLTLKQLSGDAKRSQYVIIRVHDDKMRMDEEADDFAAIVDLKTRDSITLFTNIKRYLTKSGDEVRQEMAAERAATHGTNELDAAPALPVDTGKGEILRGLPTEIYAWTGAHGLTERLWVATNYPNFSAIQAELAKIDQFDDTGPHRNSQPEVSRLPGLVLQTVSVFRAASVTNTLVSVKLDALDPSLFELPPGYAVYEPLRKGDIKVTTTPLPGSVALPATGHN